MEEIPKTKANEYGRDFDNISLSMKFAANKILSDLASGFEVPPGYHSFIFFYFSLLFLFSSSFIFLYEN
jgi:hypothetical protein